MIDKLVFRVRNENINIDDYTVLDKTTINIKKYKIGAFEENIVIKPKLFLTLVFADNIKYQIENYPAIKEYSFIYINPSHFKSLDQFFNYISKHFNSDLSEKVTRVDLAADFSGIEVNQIYESLFGYMKRKMNVWFGKGKAQTINLGTEPSKVRCYDKSIELLEKKNQVTVCKIENKEIDVTRIEIQLRKVERLVNKNEISIEEFMNYLEEKPDLFERFGFYLYNIDLVNKNGKKLRDVKFKRAYLKLYGCQGFRKHYSESGKLSRFKEIALKFDKINFNDAFYAEYEMFKNSQDFKFYRIVQNDIKKKLTNKEVTILKMINEDQYSAIFEIEDIETINNVLDVLETTKLISFNAKGDAYVTENGIDYIFRRLPNVWVEERKYETVEENGIFLQRKDLKTKDGFEMLNDIEN